MKIISAILLAAGTSSRMGEENKLLLPFRGNPMIRHIAMQLLASPVQEVLVVLGHEEDRIRAALQGLPLRFVRNPGYLRGMTSSIQAGVTDLPADCAAFLICPGDMPLITPAHFAALLHFFEEKKKEHPAPVVRPVNGNRQGHPVLFDAFFIPQVLACQENEGCRRVIRQNPDRFFCLPMKDEACFRDMDKRVDYEQWK